MPTKNHKKGNKRKSNFHAGGNNMHLSICGGNKLSGLPPTANVSAATHIAYNVGNPQHHALVNLFPTCCDLQKQGMNPKPNACPDCAKQFLLNPRCNNEKYMDSELWTYVGPHWSTEDIQCTRNPLWPCAPTDPCPTPPSTSDPPCCRPTAPGGSCTTQPHNRITMSLDANQIRIFNEACKDPKKYWEFTQKGGTWWFINNNMRNKEENTAFLIKVGDMTDPLIKVGMLVMSEDLRVTFLSHYPGVTWAMWICKHDATQVCMQSIAAVMFIPNFTNYIGSDYFSRSRCMDLNNNDRWGRTGNTESCQYINPSPMPCSFKLKNEEYLFDFLRSGGKLVSFLLNFFDENTLEEDIPWVGESLI